MEIKLGSKGTAGNFDFEALRCLGIASMGGAGVGECLSAIAEIRRGDAQSWIRVFGALAERIVREAEHSLEDHDPVSAAEQFIRASTYYHVASFYASLKDERYHRYIKCSREVFHRALLCRPARTEIVTIPFEGAQLPGYFVSARDEPSPTLIVLGGFDSTAEELLLWLGNACGARGWNALVFEGPGQPGAMNLNPGLVFRPDYEVPVGAAIDYCLTRRDVDPAKIAIIGYSFGGYLAPRAAAMDSRIRAVIANTIGVDIPGALRMALPSLLWRLPASLANAVFAILAQVSMTSRFFLERGKHGFGAKSAAQFLRAWEPYSLWSVQDKLTVPLLVVLGEDELAEAPKPLLLDTFKFLRDLKCPVSLHTFTKAEGGAAHCQLDSPERLPPVVFPWLNRVFENASGCDDYRSNSQTLAKVVELIKKHHGAKFAAPLESWGCKRV
jgi:pimeloyl-ACP methyl ester carboxylesterase